MNYLKTASIIEVMIKKNAMASHISSLSTPKQYQTTKGLSR